MTHLRILAAALALSAASATSAFAQAAIQEPGLYAFYHPDGDVLRTGTPAPSANAMAAYPEQTVIAGPHRAHHSRSGHAR